MTAVYNQAKKLIDYLWKTDCTNIPFHLVCDLKIALDNEKAVQTVAPEQWYSLVIPELILGRTYFTNDGSEVKMLGVSNLGQEYETMFDQHGHHRYSRSHSRIVGRCTGSPNDDAKNITFAKPPKVVV